MKFQRRDVLAFGAAGAAFALVGAGAGPATAATQTIEEAINAFTGGVEAAEGRVTLGAPEIAENGNTVPIDVTVESPMTEDDHVTEVMVLASGNPNPGVATLKFTPLNGEAEASTRIRLAKTQDVIAIAKMSDGSFFMDKKLVKVTIGGCGG